MICGANQDSASITWTICKDVWAFEVDLLRSKELVEISVQTSLLSRTTSNTLGRKGGNVGF
jgi:hypothetical protein